MKTKSKFKFKLFLQTWCYFSFCGRLRPSRAEHLRDTLLDSCLTCVFLWFCTLTQWGFIHLSQWTVEVGLPRCWYTTCLFLQFEKLWLAFVKPRLFLPRLFFLFFKLFVSRFPFPLPSLFADFKTHYFHFQRFLRIYSCLCLSLADLDPKLLVPA